MPPLTQTELDGFLAQAPVVTLCTLNSDGTIHAAPIWFKYDGGEIILGTQQDARRIKNIKKNPNVTLVVDVDQPPYKGVIVYGKAQLDYENVIAKRISLFQKYMPKANAEKLANGLASMRKPVIIRVKPTKMVS